MSTIRDVALKAEVSPATVSRVLNENSDYKIMQETKERIWKAVEELDYKLPVKKKTKKNKKSNIQSGYRIGCIISMMLGQFNDPYFMTILSGIEDRLKEMGHSIALVTTSAEFCNSYPENLDGLILMDSLNEESCNYIRRFIDNIVGIDTNHNEFDNVGYDHIAVSEMAVNHLYQKGYKEIGFIGGSNRIKLNFKRSRRLMGYLTTMDLLELPIKQDWILDTRWIDVNCKKLVSALCRENNLPRAFYAASDLMALAALEALNSYNVQVPDEVAIIGMTDIEVAKYSNPPLTTVGLPVYEMGIQAAELLVRRIEGEKSLPRRVLLPYRLVERRTT